MFESEEYRIVERIKEYIKKEGYRDHEHMIMLRNGRILDIRDYRKMVSDGRINPQDAYVYVMIYKTVIRADFYYPFIDKYIYFLNAYLSKLGFYSKSFMIAPATGLKYVADAEVYRDYLAIELTDLNTTVNNLNLPKIVFEVLGDKIINGKKELAGIEYDKIAKIYESQEPFAGYDAREARRRIDVYYEQYKYYGESSFGDEVVRIAIDYIKIFNPYRFCYDRKTWKEIDCLSIKL